MGTSMQQYKPSCSSRTVEGVLRGAFMGFAWTSVLEAPDILFGPYATLLNIRDTNELKPQKNAKQQLQEKNAKFWPHSLRARLLVSALAKNCIGFALFIGTYSGVTCTTEYLRGESDWKNTFAGGFASGLIVAAKLRNPWQVVGTAFACGTLTSVLQRWQTDNPTGTPLASS